MTYRRRLHSGSEKNVPNSRHKNTPGQRDIFVPVLFCPDTIILTLLSNEIAAIRSASAIKSQQNAFAAVAPSRTMHAGRASVG